MKKSELRQLIKEEINSILKEKNSKSKIEVIVDKDRDEVNIIGFGEDFTAVYEEDPNDKLLFIHYFDNDPDDDESYWEEGGDMPKLFEYFEKYGGKTDIDNEETSLYISLKDLEKGAKINFK
jgi:hypothetical protein